MAYDVFFSTRGMNIWDDVTLETYASVYTPSITEIVKVIVPSYDYGADIPTATPLSEQYYARCHMNDGRFEDIKLGNLRSQVNWTNDEAGFTRCVNDIWTNAA